MSLRVEKVIAPGSEGTVNVRALAPGRYEFFDDFLTVPHACERTVAVFDGHTRYDLQLAFKQGRTLPSTPGDKGRFGGEVRYRKQTARRSHGDGRSHAARNGVGRVKVRTTLDNAAVGKPEPAGHVIGQKNRTPHRNDLIGHIVMCASCFVATRPRNISPMHRQTRTQTRCRLQTRTAEE